MTEKNLEVCKVIKFRAPSPLPRIGRTVMCKRNSKVSNVGKLNIKGYCAVNSAHFSIIANECCFETGCFVYHLLQAESLKLHCSKLNHVINHKLAGNKPSTCTLYS